MKQKERARYRWELIDDFVCVYDQKNDAMSVTNDAENVIADLVQEGFDFTDRKLIYQDTTGTWDEIKIERNKFAGFTRHNADSRDELMAKLKRR